MTIEVAGRNVEMEVDTGASVSVAPTQIYSEVLSHVQLKKSTAQLQSYSGELLKVKGEAVVPIKYEMQQSMERLIVVDVSDKPAVLGRDWLSNLKLDLASLFKVDSGVFDVPEKFPQLFAEGVGTLQGYQAKITLSADAKPQFHRPRPVPYALQQKVEEELNRLQKEDIIQPVENSEWAAPIVIVRKADNSIRICGDYKVTIHPYLEMDNYPIPNAQDLFASLAGGRFFTRLDMKQAYMQMRVDASSQWYLTINTAKGLFAYTRMPFGISTAPGIWQRAMDNVLTGMPGVSCYLDDILIVGQSEEQHDERLHQVLERLSQAGLRLKREKCEFKKTRVEYLGYVLDELGLRPAERKLAAIRQAPEPSNTTELRAFLGLLNYYGRFLPNLSTMLQPLYSLLQKNTSWEWGAKQAKAFRQAKQNLLESDFLTHYDLKKPVRLACDASPYGVGACLTHVMSDGSEQPIAFASRTLTTAERGYAQLEREALALIFGVRQFHKYLVGRSFTLVTDHRPLLKILGPKEGVPTLAAARLQRWSLILSAYQYNLEYTSGVSNKEADLLSRLPIPVNVVDPNEKIYAIDHREQLPVTAQDIAKELQRDSILRQVYEYTLRGWKPNVSTQLLPYARRADELTIEDGYLLWGNRVIIPTKLQGTVLQEIHEGHIGLCRMKSLTRSFVWWPRLDQDLEEVVKTCTACQSIRNKPAHVMSHPWIYPDAPWTRLHVDFAEFKGKQYLVVIDAFTKWPEVHELGIHATTTQTVEALRRSFSCHGIPQRLVSDNGPQFVARELQDFVRADGIRHQRTPPYHPVSNGQAERFVQELKKSLKMRPPDRSISHQISLLLLKYRTTPNTTTGKTPSELLMKRELRTRLTLVRPESGGKIRDRQSERYEEATKYVRNLNPGDTVAVLNTRRDGRGKWLTGIILQRLGPTNYMVDVNNHLRYVHIEHIRRRDERSVPAVIETLDEAGTKTTTDITSNPRPTLEQTGQTEPTSPVREAQQAEEPVTIATPSLAEEATAEVRRTSSGTDRRHPVRVNRQLPLRYRQS